MEKVLLFGASGNLGHEIAKELKVQGYNVSVVVRSKEKADKLTSFASNALILDVSDKNNISNICKGYDIVISSLGKSVSINDKSKPGFEQIDLGVNSRILEDAIKNNVRKFIYVSALHSENYLHLNYFRVHHEFSEKLKRSGIDYSIVKPPAIFCAFVDLIGMAKKGQLMNMGAGDKTTNPIYEGDLAKVCVDSIKQSNATIEAGGNEIYSRKQINEIIQNATDPGKKVRTMPMGLMKMSLPLIKLVNKNMYDKFAFFTEVMQHDTLAPKVGKMNFEDYIKTKIETKK